VPRAVYRGVVSLIVRLPIGKVQVLVRNVSAWEHCVLDTVFGVGMFIAVLFCVDSHSQSSVSKYLVSIFFN